MCTGSCFTKILSVSVPVTHLMTFKWNSATDPNKLLDSVFLSPCIVSLGQRKQIYFFSAEKGIHISHRTPIIGSNRGLTTLGMPLKSWESHVQKEVISNIFLWSTYTVVACGYLVTTHIHTQIALIKVPYIHLHLMNSWVVSETLKYIDLLRP